MSYNITSFKLKRLENLVIPVPALFLAREDWWPTEGAAEDGATRFFWNDTVYLEGEIIKGYLHVSGIDWHGECSGTAMQYCLDPALEVSTGILAYVLVWEEGDYITRNVWKDGVSDVEEIEL